MGDEEAGASTSNKDLASPNLSETAVVIPLDEKAFKEFVTGILGQPHANTLP